MKKSIILILVMVLYSIGSFAQEVKIVFDVTSSDTKIHESTLRHVSMMSNAYPDSEFEVVVYSSALNMMLDEKSTVKSEVKESLERGNVTFNVCAMTLKKHKLDKTALISGVGTVPDGILEIVSKQQEGWGYIKEAN